MAKIKDFLLQLENDERLLDRYRTTKAKPGRIDLAVEQGLNQDQAKLLQSNNLKKIKQAIEDEDGGATVFCVVMVE